MIVGGILCCVVGGKMSEGINFKDDLCRCVIQIGLPYPNPNDIELIQRQEYLCNKINNDAGKIYYQNLCMKAVNQSIGRCIRHKNDFGVMLLFDHRYTTQNISKQLPKWIQKSLYHPNSFVQAFKMINNFVKKFKIK